MLEASRGRAILKHKLLPDEWSNPGVAGLIAYRLIADELTKIGTLSPAENAFLKDIDQLSKKAISELRDKGSKAFIKPIVNELMSKTGGFREEKYSEQQMNALKKTMAEKGLSFDAQKAQVVLYPEKGRAFLFVPNELLLDNTPNYIEHAHISLNDSMNPEKAREIFKKIVDEVGITKNPIFRAPAALDDKLIYLNMPTATFSIHSAVTGITPTNSQMVAVHLLRVKSPIIDKFKEWGIFCPLENYAHHITIKTETREAHHSLTRETNLQALLSASELSTEVYRIISPTKPVLDNYKSLDASMKSGQLLFSQTATSVTATEQPETTNRLQR